MIIEQISCQHSIVKQIYCNGLHSQVLSSLFLSLRLSNWLKRSCNSSLYKRSGLHCKINLWTVLLSKWVWTLHICVITCLFASCDQTTILIFRAQGYPLFPLKFCYQSQVEIDEKGYKILIGNIRTLSNINIGLATHWKQN